MNTNRWMRVALPIGVLIAGIAIAVTLVSTAPKPRQVPQQQTAMLVETVPATFSEQRYSVTALGMVKPAREVVIQPQITGVVVEVSDRLVPGGRFNADEVLFRIDPTDYRIAVATRQTQLAEAQANLALEQGRQEIARREWALFADETGGNDDPALVLREPQLKAAQAAVDAARANKRQAEVNLGRATVRAPFNAVVRAESVELGQTVSTQSQAAHLVGTDRFFVQASVPVDRLGYLAAPEKDADGAPAEIVFDVGTNLVRRTGHVTRILSDLDPQGQMARVVVAVDDPLAIAPGAIDTPLLLDSFVEVDIQTERKARVAEIRRELLRAGDTVWVYANGMLDIRPVNVAWRRERTVLVDAGLREGDMLVTTGLMTPIAGMQLRTAATDSTSLAGTAGDAPP